MADNQPIRINAARLHERLRRLAEIGATPGGGVTRLALSEEDQAGRDRVRIWFEEAGLTVVVDDLGNLIGHRAGSESGPPILLGSHCDSVIRGGKYDGPLGVLGALEVVETLNEHGIQTRRPIAVVNWTNEEGVRFEPAMTSSGAVTGRFTRDYVYERTDRRGVRFIDALTQIGYLGDVSNRPLPAAAYLELHIEQGPVLEAADLPVGIVGGIVGITWLEVVLEGQSDHAGPSPMGLRRDALAAAARIIAGVERLAWEQDEVAVATVGRLSVEPNIINTIPGRVVFSVDLRHPDSAVLDLQISRLEALVADVAAQTGVNGNVRRFWTSEPTPFNPDVIAAIRGAATDLNLPVGDLWSGAGHDAKYLADVCPSAMIFVRSQGGLSHCEAEFSTEEDVEAGANMLLWSALRLAEIA